MSWPLLRQCSQLASAAPLSSNPRIRVALMVALPSQLPSALWTLRNLLMYQLMLLQQQQKDPLKHRQPQRRRRAPIRSVTVA